MRIEMGNPKPTEVTVITTDEGPGIEIPKAFATVAESNHPWLTLKIEPTAGGHENLKSLAEMSAEEREITVITAAGWEIDRALKGGAPVRLITAQSQRHVFCFATIDENIRTYQDLVGKKVTTWRGGGPLALTMEMLETWGIKDQVEVMMMDAHTLVVGAVREGQADACLISLDLIDEEWVLVGWARSLQNPYLITWDQAFADKVPGMMGYYRPTLLVPAGTIGSNQPEPVNTAAIADYFACYDDIDRAIPYEIAKLQAEYAAQIAEQTGFAKSTPFVQKHLVEEPFTKRVYHSAALKYFDEAGVTIPE